LHFGFLPRAVAPIGLAVAATYRPVDREAYSGNLDALAGNISATTQTWLVITPKAFVTSYSRQAIAGLPYSYCCHLLRHDDCAEEQPDGSRGAEVMNLSHENPPILSLNTFSKSVPTHKGGSSGQREVLTIASR
jgi:hypothetical protein